KPSAPILSHCVIIRPESFGVGESMSRIQATILLAGLWAAGQLVAQNNKGRISGTVLDHSGAVIPGASVIVTDRATKLALNATTDNNGFYVVTNLAVGIFDVSIEAAGFRKAGRTGYDLVDAGRITADFRLEVGSVSETIVVTEVAGETVNTTSGELGN